MNDLMRMPRVLMRGGTSKGPHFLTSDLPADPGSRDQVLLAVMGSGHWLEIDGIGGGNPLTSKVAIVNPSKQPGADVHPSGCLDIWLEKHSDYIEPRRSW